MSISWMHNFSSIRPGCMLLSNWGGEHIHMFVLDVVGLQDIYAERFLRLIYIGESGMITRRYLYPGDEFKYKILLSPL